MSKAFNMEDPAVVRRLLPAMRRMVRFPAKSVGTISTELNIELSQLEGFVKAYGRPTEAKIETLEDWLAGLEPTKVEAVGHVWTQKTFPPRAEVSPKSEVRSGKPRRFVGVPDGGMDFGSDALREYQAGTKHLAPNRVKGNAEPYTTMLSVRPNVIAGWIPELRKLANGVPVMDVVAGTDKTAQSLWKLKRRYFGLNMLTPARFEAFLAWCQEKGVEVPAEAGGSLKSEVRSPKLTVTDPPVADKPVQEPGPESTSKSTSTKQAEVAPLAAVRVRGESAAGHGAFVVNTGSGELFRLEVVVRLVPVKGGEE